MQAVSDALEDLDFRGSWSGEGGLAKAIEGGPKSADFTGLVALVCGELKTLLGLEESVNATRGPDDATPFLLELSSFLKEIRCPYSRLTAGHLSSRLNSAEDRLLLLDHLLSELMVARMAAVREPAAAAPDAAAETETAKDLKEVLIALKFNKPPPEIAVEEIFAKIEAKLKENIQKEGPDYAGRPLYNKATTEKQWKEIESVHRQMCEEYKMRRQMLIARLDCTIQSFEWSDSGKTKREEIQSIYQPLRKLLKANTSVRLSDFLAARDSLLALKKTSDASVRVNTKSQINKVIIGKVPDRGGRPSEQEPPPPEMPSWQQQRSQGGGDRGGGNRGRGRGGSGFGGGSKVQGGWNQQDSRVSGDFSNQTNQSYDNRQKYQDNRSAHQDSRPSQSYHNQSNQGYDNNGHNNQSRGYQNQNYNQGQHFQQNQGDYYSQGYSNQRQESQPYNQNQGYQNQGYQGKGRYQNEHDNRGNFDGQQGHQRGRGRSNYNRGGRY